MCQDYNVTLFFKIGWLHEKLLNFIFGPVFIDHPVYVYFLCHVFFHMKKNMRWIKTTLQKLSANYHCWQYQRRDCEDNLCINKLVIKIDFEGSEFEYQFIKFSFEVIFSVENL